MPALYWSNQAEASSNTTLGSGTSSNVLSPMEGLEQCLVLKPADHSTQCNQRCIAKSNLDNCSRPWGLLTLVGGEDEKKEHR